MNFVQVIVMADGSYGPVEGAMIIAIPEENNNAEDIEETIDAIRMCDYPPETRKILEEAEMWLGVYKLNRKE